MRQLLRLLLHGAMIGITPDGPRGPRREAAQGVAQLAALAAAAGAAGAGGHPAPGMSLKKVPVEAGEPLRLEIEAFLEAVRERTEPVVTVEDGRAALALALEINAAIAEHSRRTGL